LKPTASPSSFPKVVIYQSYQSGIETTIMKSVFIGGSSTNRTNLELKPKS